MEWNEGKVMLKCSEGYVAVVKWNEGKVMVKYQNNIP
jgi:hypothetical protein